MNEIRKTTNSFKTRREALGISKARLAEVAGISRPQYTNIENGHVRGFRLETKLAIEGALEALEKERALEQEKAGAAA